MTTATDRGDLAEDLLPVAARLTTLVHGDGGPEDIHALLDQLDEVQRNALLVVLAGLTDPDRPLGALLGWLDINEHGQTVVPDWNNKTTLRTLADEQHTAELADWDGVDSVAIDRWLSGAPVTLDPAARRAAMLQGLRRGMSYTDMDHLRGAKPGTTCTAIRRARQAALDAGEPFPDDLLPTAPGSLSAEVVVEMRERSAAGATDVELALVWGVSRQTVSAIVRGLRYPNYGGPLREQRNTCPSPATHAL